MGEQKCTIALQHEYLEQGEETQDFQLTSSMLPHESVVILSDSEDDDTQAPDGSIVTGEVPHCSPKRQSSLSRGSTPAPEEMVPDGPVSRGSTPAPEEMVPDGPVVTGDVPAPSRNCSPAQHSFSSRESTPDPQQGSSTSRESTPSPMQCSPERGPSRVHLRQPQYEDVSEDESEGFVQNCANDIRDGGSEIIVIEREFMLDLKQFVRERSHNYLPRLNERRRKADNRILALKKQQKKLNEQQKKLTALLASLTEHRNEVDKAINNFKYMYTHYPL